MIGSTNTLNAYSHTADVPDTLAASHGQQPSNQQQAADKTPVVQAQMPDASLLSTSGPGSGTVEKSSSEIIVPRFTLKETAENLDRQLPGLLATAEDAATQKLLNDVQQGVKVEPGYIDQATQLDEEIEDLLTAPAATLTVGQMVAAQIGVAAISAEANQLNAQLNLFHNNLKLAALNSQLASVEEKRNEALRSLVSALRLAFQSAPLRDHGSETDQPPSR